MYIITWKCAFSIVGTLVVYFFLFIFEDLPTSLIACGAAGQLCHLLILRNFPYFDFTSPAFLFGIEAELSSALSEEKVLIMEIKVIHSYWVTHASDRILAYFTVCVWLIPFAFFVSLSANENVLPSYVEARPLLSDVPYANCSMPALLQFPKPLMSPTVRDSGGIIVHIVVCLYLFVALAIVCDNYFVPSLDAISNSLHLSSDVAGATFMAAGSSGPELASTFIGVFVAKASPLHICFDLDIG
ncbi:unnamed protein product [Darwinula stevensoni]|uniref:Sodium/calcium exchanger membrane region domain-containing protein n=1 Tax=Darwinula stevensoni TaxID=69355 RepID=A0A7R8XAA8_9CRUS|nr:unnamed protein product [Darwinula stevensoni]CAG0890088.1 unnamed protein product [Darwinula stevensoni]